ncbi:MAG: signal peptidase II [Deltaproteobacteria bacterium]|jgi:signal peptidase II|nr:signal peptidase II [Deltaproteobacteria bacterium]
MGKKLKITLLGALLVFVLDYVTKWWVLKNVGLLEVRKITGFFNLILVHNQGAAFSLFWGNDPSQGLKMAFLALVALIPVVYFFLKAREADKLILFSLGIIFGGAVGNIVDRLRHNAVVDFLDFHLFDRHWPAFNVSDIAICLGVLFLFYVALFQTPPWLKHQSGPGKAPTNLKDRKKNSKRSSFK